MENLQQDHEQAVKSDETMGPTTDSFQRFKCFASYFCMFLQSVVPERPLILLLIDNLHWADEAALGLLHLMLSDTKGVLFMGTFRDDNDNDANLWLAQNALPRGGDMELTHIQLGNLPEPVGLEF